MKSNAVWATIVVLLLISSSIGAYLILNRTDDDDPPYIPEDDGDPPYVEPTGEVPFRGKGAFLSIDFNYEYGPLQNYDTCYYTDDFFRWPSSMYDQSLASASYCLTVAAFNNSYNWYVPAYYYAEALLNDLGFENIEANDDFKIKPQPHTIAAVVGMKTITCDSENDTTVIALTIRGNGYGDEWASNFTIGYGTDSENHHKGFYDSQKRIREFLDSYIIENDISGNVKIWLTGFSRGAAVANTLAGILDTAIAKGEKPLGDDIHLTKHGLYTYTFGTPTTICYDSASDSPDPRSDDYNNIKSILNYGDVIPMMMFKGLGFERYGKDIMISDPTSDDFDENKEKVIDIFNLLTYEERIDHYFLDGFVPYRIDLSKLLTDTENVISYDPNAAYTDIAQVLNIAFDEMSQMMEGREWYVDNVESIVTRLYDNICEENYIYGLDTFVNILIFYTMQHDNSHLMNILLDTFMNKSISKHINADIERTLYVLGKDVSLADDIAEGLSDLALVFRGILFSGNSTIINSVITIGMNMEFMSYAHQPYTYRAWLMVLDPVSATE